MRTANGILHQGSATAGRVSFSRPGPCRVGTIISVPYRISPAQSHPRKKQPLIKSHFRPVVALRAKQPLHALTQPTRRATIRLAASPQPPTKTQHANSQSPYQHNQSALARSTLTLVPGPYRGKFRNNTMLRRHSHSQDSLGKGIALTCTHVLHEVWPTKACGDTTLKHGATTRAKIFATFPKTPHGEPCKSKGRKGATSPTR